MGVCVCWGWGEGGGYLAATEHLYVCRCFDNTWQTALLSWIPISLSIINPGPITPVVITETQRCVQVQQCVSVASYKEVMNKSIQTIGSSLENITLCTHALWQLIEGSPWAECSTDITIKDPVLVLLYSPKLGSAPFVIIKKNIALERYSAGSCVCCHSGKYLVHVMNHKRCGKAAAASLYPSLTVFN